MAESCEIYLLAVPVLPIGVYMDRIVECVPNFSEGRNPGIIDAILGEVRKTDGVELLSSEMDRDYNRTVVIFVGTPEGVVNAAFNATKKALELIDMTIHEGEHPRMGAVDVVPFIPVRGVTMEDCVKAAKEYGRQVGEALGVPVYLYENAATSPDRRNLANVRKGQYEGLGEKLKDPLWKPDFGPGVFVPRSGAVITGARKFLVAYNVNLATNDVSIAKTIAENVRESGKILLDADGGKVLDDNGKPMRVPGRLKAVKGMGVLLEAQNIAQVSMNLVDYEETPPHAAYIACSEEAKKLGSEVTGSEIVGVVPEDALIMAGRHYARETGMEADDKLELIRIAEKNLGLSHLSPFKIEEKVIEYMLGG